MFEWLRAYGDRFFELRRMPPLTAAFQDQQVLIRYLVGLLPTVETERLDEASIVDDECAVRLADAETDLIDAYVAGALEHDLRRPFEQVYLASNDNRRRVESARRFRVAIDRAVANAASPRIAFARPFLAAAATLFVTTGLLTFHGTHGSRWSPQRSPRDPVGRVASEPAAIVLSPLVRAGGDVPTAAINPATRDVAFDLRLETKDYNRFLATLVDARDNKPLWQSRPLMPFTRGTASLVTIRVPASVLAGTHYSVELVGVDASGGLAVVGGYAVRIEHR